jgi:hypothetical protein
MSNIVLAEELAALGREHDIDATYHVITSFKQNVSTTVLDDLWEVTGVSVIPYPNGIQLAVSSDNANDTALGTGTRTVNFHYLDTNYIEKSEIITLNGLTPVNTVATNIQRILNFHTQTVGSNGVAVGNVSVKNLAGTVTFDMIKAGGNQSLTGHFTIPAGKIGYVTGWQATSTKQALSIRLRATRDRHDGTLLSGVFIFHDAVNLNNSTSGQIRFTSFLKCQPKTDIKLSAIGTGAAGGDCSGSFAVILVNKQS